MNGQEMPVCQIEQEAIKQMQKGYIYQDNSLKFFLGREGESYWVGVNRIRRTDEGERDSHSCVSKVLGNEEFPLDFQLVRGITKYILSVGYDRNIPFVETIDRCIEDFPNINGNINPLNPKFLDGLGRTIFAPHNALLDYWREHQRIKAASKKMCGTDDWIKSMKYL